MARAANTYSTTLGAVDQGAKTQSVTHRRYSSSTGGVDDNVDHWCKGPNTSSPPTSLNDKVNFNADGTDWDNFIASKACDTTHYWRCFAKFWDDVGQTTLNAEKSGFINSYLTYAIDPTYPTPGPSGATSSTIAYGVTWRANTVETTATANVQYKKSVDSTWTTFASPTGSGYGDQVIDTIVSGLEAETSYDFRLQVTRAASSNPTKTYNSASASLSTIADTPSVTTDAASSIGIDGATLNGTVDHNTVDGALSWRWILTASYSAPPDDAQGTEVAYTSNPITEDGSGSYNVTGLTASTGYTFWAIYDPTGAGDTVFGAAATFTTTADPGAEASDEDHMITQYVDVTYAATPTITFTLRSPSGTSSNEFYTGTAPTVATDAEVWIDGVSDGQLDNAITRVAGSVAGNILYTTTMSTAQTSGSVIDIVIKDSDATEVFRDHHIQLRTVQNLSQVKVDASGVATNTTAVTYTGNGTGAGLSCVGGDNDGKDIDGTMANHVLNYGTAQSGSGTAAVLDASTAVATDDHYNGAILLTVGGTGPGQARTITDYTGSGTVCVLNKAWAVNLGADTEYVIIPGPDTWAVAPGAELSALPTFTSNYADMLQFLFQRFVYKRTQTSTTFTMLKDNGSDTLASGGVDDDNTTQTHNELA